MRIENFKKREKRSAFANLYSRNLILNSGITELSTRVIQGVYSNHEAYIPVPLPLSFLKSSASCLSVTISFRLTILGWFSCRRILISRTAVMGKPSFSFSSRTFFKATSSSENNHFIIHTAQIQAHIIINFKLISHWDVRDFLKLSYSISFWILNICIQ